MVYNDGMAGIQTHMRRQRVRSKEPTRMTTYALVFDALFVVSSQIMLLSHHNHNVYPRNSDSPNQRVGDVSDEINEKHRPKASYQQTAITYTKKNRTSLLLRPELSHVVDLVHEAKRVW